MQKYRESFAVSELGRIYAQLPLKEMQVKHRIVSIDRPYIKSLVRGKENKRVEFGAKVNNIQIDGISFIEHHSFEAFNEGVRLKECIEYPQELTGTNVTGVGADTIYANNVRSRVQQPMFGERHNALLLPSKPSAKTIQWSGSPRFWLIPPQKKKDKRMVKSITCEHRPKQKSIYNKTPRRCPKGCTSQGQIVRMERDLRLDGSPPQPGGEAATPQEPPTIIVEVFILV